MNSTWHQAQQYHIMSWCTMSCYVMTLMHLCCAIYCTALLYHIRSLRKLFIMFRFKKLFTFHGKSYFKLNLNAFHWKITFSIFPKLQIIFSWGINENYFRFFTEFTVQTFVYNFEVYEEPVTRTKEIPQWAVKFEVDEDNRIVYQNLY